MPLFSKIINNIQRKTPLTIVSTTNVRNWALRKCMLDEMRDASFGAKDSGFLAEPFFEAMFPWKQNNVLLNDQMALPSGDTSNVHNIIRRLHVNRDNEPIPRLYEHQARALKSIREGKSIVVTTGTGSGKTECFMYPIYDYLARQVENGESIGGVQALFLYPLNALIESQGDRFRKFCATFNQWCHERDVADRVHFANYTGKMEETFDDAIKSIRENLQNIEPNVSERQLRDRYAYSSYDEIISRDILRSNPPQFLITNSTMLEYAMVRKQDAPLFRNANGRSPLKFIVLDEAHTYSGSNAAELALRLRRVLEAFGTTPDQVQFIATSASIGDDGNAEDRTKKFLADISGVNPENVDVISGNRHCDGITPIVPARRVNEVIESMHDNGLSKEEKYNAFASCKTALNFRNEILNQKRMNLTSIQNYLGVDSTADVLTFLDYASECNFIPLKAHLFQKQFFGIWACCNPDCCGKQDALLDDEWKYGRVFFDLQNVQRRLIDGTDSMVSMYACPSCGHNVFLTVNCQNCGEVYLAAQTDQNIIDNKHVLRIPKLLDEIEEDSSDDDQDENTSFTNRQSSAKPVLLHASNIGHQSWTEYVAEVNPQNDGPVHLAADNEILNERLTYIEFDASNRSNRCGKCRAILHVQESMNNYGGFPLGHGTNIAGFGVPAKALYSSLVNDVLLEDPIEPDAELPALGKKILTFTDSRQGTATFAGKQGILAEMDATRVWILAHLLETPNEDVSVREMLRFIRRKIVDVRNQINHIPNGNNANQLSYKECFNLPHNIADELITDRSLANLFLWRELTFRSRRKRSLESLGLLRVMYDGLDQISAPQNAALDALHFTDESYQKCLKIILDFGFRQRGAVEANGWIDSQIRACYGSNVAPGPVDVSVFDQDEPSDCVIAKILLYYLRNENGAADSITDLIRNNWNLIRVLAKQIIEDLAESQIINGANNKYKLDFSTLIFCIPQQVWLCPTTSSLLDVLIENPFTGVQYTPFILGRSNPIRLPVESAPIVIQSNIEQEGNWNVKTESIQQAYADQPWWSDLHESVIKANPDNAFVVAQENSAQLSAEERARDQHMFVDGRINIMNCSTTMEMGVDIGGISLVAMTNVPPHEYNYLQRAGRAGRSEQPQSFIWTLASFGKHERMALEDPLAWVNSNSIRADVTKYGRSILQRHVNAYLLNRWLVRQQNNILARTKTIYLRPDSDLSVYLENLILKRGTWLNPPTIDDFCEEIEQERAHSPISQFINEIDAIAIPDSIRNPFNEYCWDEQDLKNKAKECFECAQTKWVNKLCEYYGILKQDTLGNLDYATLKRLHRVKICYYLRQMLVENGLNTLVDAGILPSNSMPTNVVELDLYPENNRDGFASQNGNPQRERKIAIREYAPGFSIVVNGIRRVSRGIEFEGSLYGRERSVTVIKRYMTCDRCGNPQIELLDGFERNDEGRLGFNCSCGNYVLGTPRLIVEPLKFFALEEDKSVESTAKSLYEMPHVKLLSEEEPHIYAYNNEEVMRVSWGDAKIIFLNGDGRAKNRNAAAQRRQTPVIEGFPSIDDVPADVNNNVSEDDHYMLCTHCGFMFSENLNPAAAENLHRKFSSSWNHSECDKVGLESELYHVSLGAIIPSKAVVIHIPNLNEVAAMTWALALRNALAERLSVDYSELGWTAQQHGFVDGGAGYDIILFDNAAGGSDYCLKAKDDLLELFMAARQHLECHANCDSICLECLLSRETQVMANLLNRRIALDALTDEFFSQLQVPEEKRYWGENTKFVRNFYTFINECVSNPEVTKIRFYLPENTRDWALSTWTFRQEVRVNEEKFELAISHALWLAAQNDLAKKLLLDELLHMNRNFGYVDAIPVVGNGKNVLVEMTYGNETYQYVVEKQNDRDESENAQNSHDENDDELNTSTENENILMWRNPQYLHAYGGLCESVVPMNMKTTEDLHFAASPMRFPSETSFPIENFAQQLITEVCAVNETLPDGVIQRIVYYDRYVQTPMCLRILGEIVKYLHPRRFELVTSGSSFTLHNYEQEHNDRYPKPYHNVEAWCYDYPKDQRGRGSMPYRSVFYKQVIDKIVNDRGVDVRVGTNFNVQHDREMFLEYENGERRLIRFTGGVGMWVPSEDINYWNGAATEQPSTIGLGPNDRLRRTFEQEANVIADARDFNLILKDSTSIIISRESLEE